MRQNYTPSSRITTTNSSPSSWRLWRHCCCRYGWYPLLLALVNTSGCILSLYSAAGCDFVRVDVGFAPTNSAFWKSNDNTASNSNSYAELGLFLYQSGEDDNNTNNRYQAALFLNGCRRYTEEFVEEFIQKDRTWSVSQIMAFVAAGGGILSTIMAWLFVLTPVPAALFLWSAIMLPTLMAAFLAEGSKFLFFDISICQNNIWFPQGSDSLAQVAEDCSLGTTGKYTIAAAATFCVSLVAVCFKAPTMRDLEPNYGMNVDDHGERSEIRDNHDDAFSSERDTGFSRFTEDDGELDMICADDDESDDFSFATTKGYDYSDIVSMEFGRSKSKETSEEEINNNNDRYNPKKPPLTIMSPSNSDNANNPGFVVSKSRLSTALKLSRNVITPSSECKEGEQLINNFVKEFNASFDKDNN